jgi:hypothetical protein
MRKRIPVSLAQRLELPGATQAGYTSAMNDVPGESLGRPLADAAITAPVAPRFSKKRILLAVVIAGLSDVMAAYLILAPPIVWVIDVVTALLLFIVLGWSWWLLPGLIMEAIPGWSIIPSWLIVVGTIAVTGSVRPKAK